MNTEITQTTNFLNNKIKTRNYIKSALVLSAILLGCLSVKSQACIAFDNSVKQKVVSGFGHWCQDPLTADGPDITYEFPTFDGKIFYSYPTLADFNSNTNRISHTLPLHFAGTGHTVYDGYLYYNQYGSQNMVKYDISSGTSIVAVLPNASYNSSGRYRWGGYTDMDFSSDESGLWVTYTTTANGGKVVVSKLDTSNLSIIQTWNTNSEQKKYMGDSFIKQGKLYCLDDYYPTNGVINYIYDFATSTGVASSCPITFNGIFHLSLDYNFNTKSLNSWSYYSGPDLTNIICSSSYSYSITDCPNYVSPSGKTWTTSGIYQDTILNTSGCDSLLTINLTIVQNKTNIVMNSKDNGPGSLRDLVSGSCRNDTISFDASTNGHPIVLSSGQIILNKDIVITGIDSASTIIDGGNLGRIFNIAPGVTVTLTGVKLQNGKAKEGGAIYNAGNLTLNTVLLTNNKAKISNLGYTNGGAIYNKGQMTITNSSLISNSATSAENSHSYGGAIYNVGSCVMSNSEANGNSVESFHGLVLGGAIYNGNKANFDLSNSSMSGNSATSEYYGFGGAIVNRRHVTFNNLTSTFNDNTSTTYSDQHIYNILSPNFITTPPIIMLAPVSR